MAKIFLTTIVFGLAISASGAAVACDRNATDARRLTRGRLRWNESPENHNLDYA